MKYAHLRLRLQEAGLLGSQTVASTYERRGINVLAQIQVRRVATHGIYRRRNPPFLHRLQFDMTAWIMKGTQEEFGIIRDKWVDGRSVRSTLESKPVT